MTTKKHSAPPEGPKIVTSDPNGAPIVFFDGADNFGTYGGIVHVTLSALRHLPGEESVDVDGIVVAFLRGNLHAAKSLRDALDKAILMATPFEGSTN